MDEVRTGIKWWSTAKNNVHINTWLDERLKDLTTASFWTFNIVIQSQVELRVLVSSFNFHWPTHKRHFGCHRKMDEWLMSRSIPTGYIPPPGNPGENFLSELIPAIRAIFCLIPFPRAKIIVEFPESGAKFSQTRRNCSVLSLQKSFKN